MSNYSDSVFDKNNTNNSWYLAANFIPANSLVLDIGCSSGHFGEALIAERGCIVDGVELDEKDAQEASTKLRKVFTLNVETDELSTIDGGPYDIVYLGDVIEHLVTPAKTLRRIGVLLKPTGKLVFSVPNMAHLTVRLQLLKGDFEYTETSLLDKTHLHFYTLNELEKVINEANMQIQKLEFVKKDYPNALINDYLAPLGLKGNKKFYDLMREPAAAAFQFVGSAILSSKPKPINRKQFGPIDLFESYFNDNINTLKHQIKMSHDDVETLKEEKAHLEKCLHNITHHPLKTGIALVTERVKRFSRR